MAGYRQESTAQYTKRVLGQKGRAKKALGQNFLMDDGIIARIVDEGIPEGVSPLVEIGPGPGGLTRVLLERGEPTWVVELDQEKVQILLREFTQANLSILHMDALKLQLKDLWGEKKGWLVGNLPYYITNPLLMHFLSQRASLLGMTIMVQKEVGERLTATPGGRDYGILSIATQRSAQVRKLFDVPPSAFYPQPKVTSSVLRLDLRPYPDLVTEEAFFFKVVKGAFSQRRKKILNTLSGSLGLAKEVVAARLAEAGIGESLRAEDLSIPDYDRIAQGIQGYLKDQHH